jgi:hypothetical protein
MHIELLGPKVGKAPRTAHQRLSAPRCHSYSTATTKPSPPAILSRCKMSAMLVVWVLMMAVFGIVHSNVPAGTSAAARIPHAGGAQSSQPSVRRMKPSFHVIPTDRIHCENSCSEMEAHSRRQPCLCPEPCIAGVNYCVLSFPGQTKLCGLGTSL